MLDYISNYTTHKLKIIIHEHFVFEIFSSGEVKNRNNWCYFYIK